MQLKPPSDAGLPRDEARRFQQKLFLVYCEAVGRIAAAGGTREEIPQRAGTYAELVNVAYAGVKANPNHKGARDA